MRRIGARLLSSSVFRLTLAYGFAFGASALALLTFVYVAAVEYMEQQARETIEADAQGLIEAHALGGVHGLVELVNLRSTYDPDRASVYLVVDRDGRHRAGRLASWPEEPPDERGFWRLQVREREGERPARQILARAIELDSGARLLVGRDIADKLHTQRLLQNAIVGGTGLMLLLGLFGGFALARWTIGRLEEINRTTSAIMAGHLGRRIAVEGGGDEFDELAQNLNAMLERIEQLVASMREVTDNIAHDLRTPLNRIRSRIEVALLHDIDRTEARELLEATMRDADALISTFNALLSIARAEAGARGQSFEPVDLAALARDVVELYEPLAEERAMELSVEAPRSAVVPANRQLLAQALANLVDNAIKYTPEGGRVRVRVNDGPEPLLSVTDNGPGIPPALREKALERFVRLEPHRSTPGNGLGLALVAAVAKLHEAKLELDDARPGLEVRLRFPPSARQASANALQSAGASG
ncbi:MAG: HAMP domain-containing histidine kinase [Geminicoccaceae bacterium]|nr:HAMP domain-containing histidine kinase [Geminicoccaceae bacterium]MCS7267269.1 HAMP domain-containing histidine kinase [Geminicoccaceae bacterium]MCX7630569.1 HAMP domain-containing histidine kinase [Geminicoccaceae bacterium]MDW8124797.1 HAMP domain-containing sensor histidine kinase [Geminicoccaceae bacterium]MDW8340679.1 HAMP domain-containing sensor histidine kinase [Geminicoccaceae bacterium]